MNIRNQLLCVWCGPLAMVFFFIGVWPLAQFIPPWPPSASASEVAALYQQNTNGIRAGMICLMFAAALLVPMAAVITTQMKRIEGSFPALAYTQLGSAILVVMVVLMPAIFYTIAAYRPDRSPELTMILNDLAWITFLMPFTPGLVQDCAIGFAILSDRSPRPVFPRWVGFFNIWVGVLLGPGIMITFFKTGPFAWNGLLAFYLPVGVFGLWFAVMIPALFKAVREQDSSGEVRIASS